MTTQHGTLQLPQQDFFSGLYLFYFGDRESYKGRGRIWKDWKMNSIWVHDVKFTKSQQK